MKQKKPSKYPISVFIIAKNEEDRIPESIKSVIDWVDEVIVIDSGSTDRTVQISKELGATVIYNEWNGYGLQKIFGENRCKNNWILNIDADESITTDLKQEIQYLFDKKQVDKRQAYDISIRIVSRFATKPPGFFAPSKVFIRLYDKNFAGFKDSSVHDSVAPKTKNCKVGKLKYTMTHRCFRSYSHAIEKINFYSSMQAHDMLDKGRKPSKIRIVTEPIITFLKAYTLRRYFLLGIDGFIESIIYAFARTIRLAKTYEKWQEKTKVNN